MDSRIYAEQAANRGEQIVSMLCLETIGFYRQQSASQRFPFPPMTVYSPD